MAASRPGLQRIIARDGVWSRWVGSVQNGISSRRPNRFARCRSARMKLRIIQSPGYVKLTARSARTDGCVQPMYWRSREGRRRADTSPTSSSWTSSRALQVLPSDARAYLPAGCTSQDLWDSLDTGTKDAFMLPTRRHAVQHQVTRPTTSRAGEDAAGGTSHQTRSQDWRLATKDSTRSRGRRPNGKTLQMIVTQR